MIAGAALVAVGLTIALLAIVREIVRRRRLRSFLAGWYAPSRRPELAERFSVSASVRWTLGAVAAAVGAGLLAQATTHQLLITIIASTLAGVVTLGVRARNQRARKALLRTQFADAVAALASSMAAGNSFIRALQSIAADAAEPLHPELEQMVIEVDLGFPVSATASAMAARTRIPEARWLAHVLKLHETTGSPASALLQQLSEMVREQEGLTREVRALTAEGRLAAYVVSALPAVLVVFLQMSQPTYLDVFSRGWGIVVSMLMVVMVLGGLVIIRRMVTSLEV